MRGGGWSGPCAAVGIEIGNDCAAQFRAGGGTEKQRVGLDILLDALGEIAGGVGELGKDDELPLGEGGGELCFEFQPLRIALDGLPRGLDVAQSFEVGLNVLLKDWCEGGGVESFGFLLRDKHVDRVIIALLQ